MTEIKTLKQREKELQALLATTTGRQELQNLASQYASRSSMLRTTGKSPITYILVHERTQGLIGK